MAESERDAPGRCGVQRRRVVAAGAAMLAVVAACTGTVHSPVGSRSSPVPGSSSPAAGPGVSAPGAAPVGIHKIAHVIVIMQENRSFDTYFGTYPGADGIPMSAGRPSACLPAGTGRPCVHPYVNHADVNGGGPHGQTNATADIDGGKMDGFVTEASRARNGCTDPNNPADGQQGLMISTIANAGNQFLTLQYKRLTSSPGLPIYYIPEVSADHAVWYSDASHLAEISVAPLDAQFDLVTVQDLTPITGGAPRFIRLRVGEN